MLIELGLGDLNGFLEILVGQLGIDDGVAVLSQEALRLQGLLRNVEIISGLPELNLFERRHNLSRNLG